VLDRSLPTAPEFKLGPGFLDYILQEQPLVDNEFTFAHCEARALVEARLPRPDVLAATDPLVRGLLRTGCSPQTMGS
jgi:hypothetical protein